MLMLLIALALLIIGLAVAAPKMAQQIRHDREEEMIHRGVQYARAVKRYYKKFSRYPTTIEQLENTNNIRFLRKRYSDPMSKDGKWRPVRYGEVQFGQQGGSPGQVGGGNSGGALPPVVGGTLNQEGGTSPQSNTSPASSFGASTFGTQSGSNPGQQPGGSIFGQQGSNASNQPGGLSASGQSFGGGAILGVASTSEAKGFHEYNQKSQYKQWFFVYDPNQDRGGLITGPYNPKAFVGSNQIGTPAGQTNPQPGSPFPSNPSPFQPTQPMGGQSTTPR